MPASLYRLAGKPHHSDAPTPPAQEQASVPEQAAIEQQVEIQKEEFTAVEPAPEPLNEQPFETEETLSSPVEADPKPEWDASWSKSQLLVVANQLGLNLTSVNTKSEIVAALTSATSS
jgi:hypothetical protein